jgi:hypothetical protein
MASGIKHEPGKKCRRTAIYEIVDASEDPTGELLVVRSGELYPPIPKEDHAYIHREALNKPGNKCTKAGLYDVVTPDGEAEPVQRTGWQRSVQYGEIFPETTEPEQFYLWVGELLRGEKLERENLYSAAPWLSRQNREALGLTVPATIYVQDPAVAEKWKSQGKLGLEEVHVTRERTLSHGPTSARIAVVDYDGDTGHVRTGKEEQAWWKDAVGRFLLYADNQPVAIGADHADTPQFRQVNVWAIIQRILDFYGDPLVMGRPIPWAFHGSRLIVVPAAGYGENAFYDRYSKSLQFYWCGTKQEPVYTCLSHDIVAHETGHAVLDGIRPYYYENSSRETAAFHEFMADLTAIVSAMYNEKIRWAIAELTGGDLEQGSVVADLAEEFGQEIGTGETTHEQGSRYFLRSAFNNLTMSRIKGELSPHKCSNVLTGAMFSILVKVVKQRLAEGASAKQALWQATLIINRIALQALDYLPPVDVQFMDYARAVVHAHKLADPLDEHGYGDLIVEAFEERGLNQWVDESQPAMDRLQGMLYPYDIDRISGSRTAAYCFLHDKRRALCIPPEQDILVSDLYETNKLTEEFVRRPREIVLEYVWEEDVELKATSLRGTGGQRVPLPCGGTLVFDNRGNVLSWARKPGTSDKLLKGRGKIPEYRKGEKRRGNARAQRLREYVGRLIDAGWIGLVQETGVPAWDVWSRPVAARAAGGTLRLEVTPHLRHAGSY